MATRKVTAPNVSDKKSSAIKTSTAPGRGGKRPGAGRKPGSINKKSADVIAKIEASGETPLEFMLNIMRDPRAPMEERMDMAKAAAPYVHAKLASVELKATVTNHEAALDELDG